MTFSFSKMKSKTTINNSHLVSVTAGRSMRKQQYQHQHSTTMINTNDYNESVPSIDQQSSNLIDEYLKSKQSYAFIKKQSKRIVIEQQEEAENDSENCVENDNEEINSFRNKSNDNENISDDGKENIPTIIKESKSMAPHPYRIHEQTTSKPIFATKNIKIPYKEISKSNQTSNQNNHEQNDDDDITITLFENVQSCQDKINQILVPTFIQEIHTCSIKASRQQSLLQIFQEISTTYKNILSFHTQIHESTNSQLQSLQEYHNEQFQEINSIHERQIHNLQIKHDAIMDQCRKEHQNEKELQQKEFEILQKSYQQCITDHQTTNHNLTLHNQQLIQSQRDEQKKLWCDMQQQIDLITSEMKNEHTADIQRMKKELLQQYDQEYDSYLNQIRTLERERKAYENNSLTMQHKLNLQINERDSNIATLEDTISNLNTQIQNLKEQIQTQTNEITSLTNRIQQQETQFGETIDNLQKHHQTELENIDCKVQSILKKKDIELQSLLTRVRQADDRVQSYQDVLSKLENL